MSYRANPALDLQVLPHRDQGHGPRSKRNNGEDASVLIDATLKENFPPISLPKREYMERAQAIWEELGLPKLKPESPGTATRSANGPTSSSRARAAAVRGDYFEYGKQLVEPAAQGRADEHRGARPASLRRAQRVGRMKLAAFLSLVFASACFWTGADARWPADLRADPRKSDAGGGQHRRAAEEPGGAEPADARPVLPPLLRRAAAVAAADLRRLGRDRRREERLRR